MTPNHRFISFEGIDGAGKSTHIGALAQSLRDQGHNVTLTREPGGTELSEKLRELLLQEAMDPLTEALLKGWALGTDDFVERLQKLTQRRVTRAKAGRPRRAAPGTLPAQ